MGDPTVSGPMSRGRIAAATDDGKTVSRHFGRAPNYLVLTVEDGRVVGRELRDKPGHQHFAGDPHADPGHQHGPGHGLDPAAQDRHARMAAVISDCQVLLVGGMGAGAYQSMVQAGIRPIVTDIADIGQAVEAVVSGEIVDHTDRLH
jgi:predicted Fe-Mo cluster-binding NifX family protein